LLYGLKSLYGVESMHALLALLFNDEALMRLVGCNTHQVLCQRRAAARQGPRTDGPICPDTWAAIVVKLNLRDLEALFHGVMRALVTLARTNLAGSARLHRLHNVVLD
jgi:hypothetical protein